MVNRDVFQNPPKSPEIFRGLYISRLRKSNYFPLACNDCFFARKVKRFFSDFHCANAEINSRLQPGRLGHQRTRRRSRATRRRWRLLPGRERCWPPRIPRTWRGGRSWVRWGAAAWSRPPRSTGAAGPCWPTRAPPQRTPTVSKTFKFQYFYLTWSESFLNIDIYYKHYVSA